MAVAAYLCETIEDTFRTPPGPGDLPGSSGDWIPYPLQEKIGEQNKYIGRT